MRWRTDVRDLRTRVAGASAAPPRAPCTHCMECSAQPGIEQALALLTCTPAGRQLPHPPLRMPTHKGSCPNAPLPKVLHSAPTAAA